MASNPLAERRGPKIGDAASLWNFTPSPGWTKDEVAILRLCLMKHGVGRWLQILEEGLLKGKLIQQLNGQTQRLLGQQSLVAYSGLQVDVDRIRADNEARVDAERKGGLIINTGPNLTKQMKDKLKEESRAKYGLTAEQIREVEQKIEEIRASMQPAAGGSGAGASLMSADPATLSKEQKLALLKRLHAKLAAAYAQLQSAQAGGAQREPPAAAAAKPAEARRTNSNAENEPAAANTDSMEVDPPSVEQQEQEQQQPAVATNGGPTKASKEAAGAGGASGGGAKRRAGGGGGGKKARTPKPKAPAPGGESDDDWKPQRGDKGRGKRRLSEDAEMQDSEATGATAESAADAVHAANVAQLAEMGFSTRQARQALEECNGCLESALEWLAINCI